MYYEINVSLNGTHFFATDKRSITCKVKLKKVLPVIKTKFPDNEGYEISVTEYPQIGYGLNVDKLLKEL